MRWALSLVSSVLIVGCSSTQPNQNDMQEYISSGSVLFLRGDMTNWDALPEYQVQQTSTRVFSVKANLPEAGKTYHFKFADAQWHPALNYGTAIDDATLSLNSPLPVRTYSYLDELKFTPEQAGTYEFMLDLRGHKPVALVKLAQ